MTHQIKKRYALLLSGGINSWNNFPRYLNDLRLMYETLAQFYSFPKENVWVLYADGVEVDLDGDGENEVYSKASKAILEQSTYQRERLRIVHLIPHFPRPISLLPWEELPVAIHQDFHPQNRLSMFLPNMAKPT